MVASILGVLSLLDFGRGLLVLLASIVSAFRFVELVIWLGSSILRYQKLEKRLASSSSGFKSF